VNNIVEQDHRRMKRLVKAGLGFGSMRAIGPEGANHGAEHAPHQGIQSATPPVA
jgi:transposase-like protein